jgi:hypothetical protein
MRMLEIKIPATEQWDELKQEFVYTKEQTLRLEHSLVSLSKWESKWCKPFLSKQDKTNEEIIDYIKCMNTTQNVDPNIFRCLSNDNMLSIKQYIEAPMTATTFAKDTNKKPNREIVTSELIYYWMIALNIPFECQKWHLNRLLTLIQVCNIKNQPPKKMSKKDIMSRNAALNAARRQQLNTKG